MVQMMNGGRVWHSVSFEVNPVVPPTLHDGLHSLFTYHYACRERDRSALLSLIDD